MKPFYFDIIISGFGGQGALIIGDILAYAGMLHGYNTSFYPSYGVEMRGGTASCLVVLTSGELYSPIMGKVGNLIALNQESIETFLPRVKKEGNVFINSSLVRCKGREDVRIIEVPANSIAEEIGVPKAMNMVMLGVLLSCTEVLTQDVTERAIKEYFPGRDAIIEGNLKALREGLAFGKKIKG